MGATVQSASRGGRRSRRGRRAPVAEINITPLVDVMLVLLIIFMVTAPLLVAGVPIDLPANRAKPLDEQAKPIQLSIDRAGKITVDEVPVSDADLPAMLAKIAAEPQPDQGRRIYLRADKRLEYDRVSRTLGELNRAGLNRVALVSDPGGTP